MITELKLRVAHGNLFPYFVVGTKYFADLSYGVRLTVVDGIIGEVLAKKATSDRFQRGFDPAAVGLSQSDFDALPPAHQHALVVDWAIGVEVEEDMAHNPVVRTAAELERQLGLPAYSYEHLTYPPVDYSRPLAERARAIDMASLQGSKCTVTSERFGNITRTVWIPNFKTPGFSGIGLTVEIAHLIALDALRVRIERG